MCINKLSSLLLLLVREYMHVKILGKFLVAYSVVHFIRKFFCKIETVIVIHLCVKYPFTAMF
jgi:hypothetical protein